MFIAGDTELIAPVQGQLLMGQQPLYSESWPGTYWKMFLLYQCLPFPQAYQEGQ